jgi:cell division protein FtsZ
MTDAGSGADGNREALRREPRGRGCARCGLVAAARGVDRGATGILLNITGGPDIGLFEVNEAAEVVTSAADANANVIFGAVIDEPGRRRDRDGDRDRLRRRAPARRRRTPSISATADPPAARETFEAARTSGRSELPARQ